MKKRAKIYYDRNDMDGLLSAWILWKYGNFDLSQSLLCPSGRDISIEKLSEEKIDPNLIYYFLDLSPKETVLRILKLQNCEAVVIDHHPESFLLKENDAPAQFFIDSNHSSAYLTWKYVFGEETRVWNICMYTESYDLWEHKLPYSESIGYYLQNECVPSGDFNKILDIAVDMEFRLDEVIERANEQFSVTKNLIQQIGEQAVCKEEVAIISTPVLQSQVAAYILNCSRFSETNLVCCFYYMPGQRTKLSFRGNGARKAALAFGGGGHEQAAGAILDYMIYPESLLNFIIKECRKE